MQFVRLIYGKISASVSCYFPTMLRDHSQNMAAGRFWNTTTNSALNCMDTGSQVCNLSWSKNVNEVVSTHGYSQNQIIVWKYPSMTKLATLTGHTLRVLYLAVSPDGQTIVTGAGMKLMGLKSSVSNAYS